MLSEATQTLITAARRTGSSEAEIRAAGQSVLSAAREAPVEEREQTVRALAELVNLDDLGRVGFIATVGGAVIECGADPLPLAQPLTLRLKPLLDSAGALADFCLSQMPKADENKGETQDQDPLEEFEKMREQSAATMPEENAAWEALDLFWRPAVAVYSRGPQARANAQGLLALAEKISEYHSAGDWLLKILKVLDNEPILVLEPGTGLGALGRISGVAENFQLQTLLMGKFPGAGLGSRIPKTVLDVVTGVGPQQTGESVIGAWNMYTWKAIQPGLTLPDPKDYKANDLWIWGEGSPDHIPVFEGRRAILLGPASYARNWSAQRIFSGLLANLELDPLLTPAEVKGWLQRMWDAKKEQAASSGCRQSEQS